jgi:hypothetical protein
MPYNTRRLPDDVKSDEEYFDETSKAYGERLGEYLNREVPPNAYSVPPLAYEGGSQPAPYPVAQGEPQGPLYQDSPGLGLGDPQGPVYQIPQQQAQAPNPMSRWADPIEQGGLGLAASPGINAGPSGRPELGDYLAAQMYPGVDLSRMERNRLAWNATQGDFMTKRMDLARQLEAQEEQKRQHDLQLFEKAMSSPRGPQMMEALSQSPGYRFAKQAQQFSRVMKDADYGSFQAYQDFIPEEIQQRFIQGKLPDHELSAWVAEARTASQANAKEGAKSTIIARAMKKKPEERSPYEQQLVNERQDAEELKHAEIDLKRAQAEQARHKAEGGDIKFTQMTQEISAELFDSPFEKLNQAQRSVVEREKERRLQGRTGTMIQQGLPVAVEKRSNVIDVNEFRKSGKLVMPARGITKNQMDKGEFVEITDKQKEQWGDIENSGVTLNTLFGMVDPLIKATTPAQALKQAGQLYAGAYTKKNAKAATYLADSEAFSSKMGKVFGGEVGVLTQGDVDRWKRALPTFGDTVEVAKLKKQVFFDIYNQARSMAQKKIAGEDMSKDVVRLQATLNKVDKIAPPSLDEDFNTIMGGK